MQKQVKVIVGSKGLHSYITAVMFALERADSVELCAAGNNICKLDRLVNTFARLSCGHITEASRKPMKYKDGIAAMSCILERKL